MHIKNFFKSIYAKTIKRLCCKKKPELKEPEAGKLNKLAKLGFIKPSKAAEAPKSEDDE